LHRAGFPLTQVAQAEWLERVASVADDEDRATLSFFELNTELTRGSPTANQAQPQQTLLPQTTACEQLLRCLPDAERAPVSDLLLDAYCEDAYQRGLLSYPTGAPERRDAAWHGGAGTA
jgi:hypothetical protein